MQSAFIIWILFVAFATDMRVYDNLHFKINTHALCKHLLSDTDNVMLCNNMHTATLVRYAHATRDDNLQ